MRLCATHLMLIHIRAQVLMIQETKGVLHVQLAALSHFIPSTAAALISYQCNNRERSLATPGGAIRLRYNYNIITMH